MIRLACPFLAAAWVLMVPQAYGCEPDENVTCDQGLTLTVRVTGAKSGGGKIHAGLFDGPDEFPDGEPLLDGAASVDGTETVLTFENVKPAVYAVSLYHDENNNGSFDRSLIGLPQEPYGFSNNISVGLSPPNFEDARITVHKSQDIVIRLQR